MEVLCIGNATYDIVLPTHKFILENSKTKIDTKVENGGGVASTVAYLLSKWGINTSFVGVVGHDYYGKKIRDELKLVGVDINYLELNKDYETPVSYIISNKATNSRTVLEYDGHGLNISNISIDKKPNIIFLDGYHCSVARDIVDKNKDAIKIIYANKEKPEIIELCEICDYVICSKEFAEQVTSTVIINLPTLNTAFNKISAMFNGKIIINLGIDGCTYKKERVELVRALGVDATDITGINSIFNGAFVYGIINNWPLEKVLNFSNLVSSISTKNYGDRNSILDLKDIEKTLNELK